MGVLRHAEAAVREVVVVVLERQLLHLHGGELRLRQEERQLLVRDEDRALGAEHHRRLLGELRETGVARERLSVLGRVELAVEPLHRERLAVRGGHAVERPRDVVGLRPRVGAPRGRVLPAFLHLGADRLRRGPAEVHALPHGVEDVAADVAAPARAEVLPRAPDHRVVDLLGVRTHRRRAEPEVPRERLRRRDALGRTRTREAVPLRARAVGREVHLLHRANRPRAEEADAQAVAATRRELRAELRDHVATLRLQRHLAALGHVVAERLLAVHVLAAAHGGERDDRVLVVGHGHVDGVDRITLLLQHLAPIGVGARVGRKLRGLGEVVRVHVAERHHLHALVREEVAQVIEAHAAHADAGVVELVVRTERPPRRGRRESGPAPTGGHAGA